MEDGQSKVLQRTRSRRRFMDSARSHLKDYIEQTITNRPFFSRWDWFNSLPYPLWYRFSRHPRPLSRLSADWGGKVRTALWWRCVAKSPRCSFILWASRDVDIGWDFSSSNIPVKKGSIGEREILLLSLDDFKEFNLLTPFDINFFSHGKCKFINMYLLLWIKFGFINPNIWRNSKVINYKLH